MAKFSLVLLGCVAVAFACLAAADVSVNIPGVVAPDIGAALNKAVQSGKLPGASAAKAGAAAPSAGVSAGQAKGQQAKGQQPQGNNADFATQLQAAGVGGRHLLQSQSCLFSGAIGSTGISVSNLDLCPFAEGAQAGSQCCSKGSVFNGKCVPGALSCICGL